MSPAISTSDKELAMLQQALPGKEISSGKRFAELSSQISAAWKFWRDNNTAEWAIFLAVGEDMSRVDQEGIRKATKLGLRPVVIAPTYNEIVSIATCYSKLKFYTICNINGSGHLIPILPKKRNSKRLNTASTRVPYFLLTEIIGQGDQLSKYLLDRLKELAKKYQRLIRQNNNLEDKEEEILVRFAEQILIGMGLKAEMVKETRSYPKTCLEAL